MSSKTPTINIEPSNTIVFKKPERTTGGLSVIQPGDLTSEQSEVTDSQLESSSAFFSASVAGVT